HTPLLESCPWANPSPEAVFCKYRAILASLEHPAAKKRVKPRVRRDQDTLCSDRASSFDRRLRNFDDDRRHSEGGPDLLRRNRLGEEEDQRKRQRGEQQRPPKRRRGVLQGEHFGPPSAFLLQGCCAVSEAASFGNRHGQVRKSMSLRWGSATRLS